MELARQFAGKLDEEEARYKTVQVAPANIGERVLRWLLEDLGSHMNA